MSIAVLFRSIFEKVIQRPTLTVFVACILLAGFVGFLLTSNYRAQMALRQSTLHRIQLDLEKRAASIGYFFSERRNDIRAMASSQEITSYFLNKSLGMSEAYGLRVSLFVIDRMLNTVIDRKTIQGAPIYERIVFEDLDGRILADTDGADAVTPAWPPRNRTSTAGESMVMISDGKNPRIFLAAPCIFQDQTAGRVITILNTEAVLTHFVRYSTEVSHTMYHLITKEGRLVFADVPGNCDFWSLASGELAERNLKTDCLPRRTDAPDAPAPGRTRLFMARKSIHNTPFALLAGVDRDAIEDTLTPWQLLVGTGSLAVVILLGVVVVLRSNARSLVLQARYTESKRQQANLAEKNRQLRDEITRRRHAEAELEKQRSVQMHSDRLRSLGEMAAGIAHELNQPLVGVRGMAEMMVITLEAGQLLDPEKTARRLQVILEQADRMVHIIDHVRRFAREAGRPETENVDLNAVVRSGIDLMKNQLQTRGLMVKLHLWNGPLPIRVNPYSLEEVILNLLTNARDALEQRARTDAGFAPRITLSTRDGDNTGDGVATLDVRDNGTGIPPDIRDRMFDPFFTTKDPDKGTGLGLSLCKSIVEELDGTIQCASAEGKGTVFTISFPINTSSQSPTPERKDKNDQHTM